jgi:hypothetical protein
MEKLSPTIALTESIPSMPKCLPHCGMLKYALSEISNDDRYHLTPTIVVRGVARTVRDVPNIDFDKMLYPQRN